MEKQPEEVALEYAGFWIRLGAYLIDGLIFLFIAWAVTYIFAILGQGSTGVGVMANHYDTGGIVLEHSFISSHVSWILAWLIEVAYFVGFWTWRGQTPGKMIAGVKVIRTDSSPVTWQYALLRYLGYIVSAMLLFIGFIWIAFDSHKQGIHDKVADTYVVKLPVRQAVLSESYA